MLDTKDTMRLWVQLGYPPDNMHLVENIDDVENLNLQGETALLAQTTLAISEWEPIMNHSKVKYPNLSMPRKSDLLLCNNK